MVASFISDKRLADGVAALEREMGVWSEIERKFIGCRDCSTPNSGKPLGYFWQLPLFNSRSSLVIEEPVCYEAACIHVKTTPRMMSLNCDRIQRKVRGETTVCWFAVCHESCPQKDYELYCYGRSWALEVSLKAEERERRLLWKSVWVHFISREL